MVLKKLSIMLLGLGLLTPSFTYAAAEEEVEKRSSTPLNSGELSLFPFSEVLQESDKEVKVLKLKTWSQRLHALGVEGKYAEILESTRGLSPTLDEEALGVAGMSGEEKELIHYNWYIAVACAHLKQVIRDKDKRIIGDVESAVKHFREVERFLSCYNRFENFDRSPEVSRIVDQHRWNVYGHLAEGCALLCYLIASPLGPTQEAEELIEKSLTSQEKYMVIFDSIKEYPEMIKAFGVEELQKKFLEGKRRLGEIYINLFQIEYFRQASLPPSSSEFLKSKKKSKQLTQNIKDIIRILQKNAPSLGEGLRQTWEMTRDGEVRGDAPGPSQFLRKRRDAVIVSGIRKIEEVERKRRELGAAPFRKEVWEFGNTVKRMVLTGEDPREKIRELEDKIASQLPSSDDQPVSLKAIYEKYGELVSAEATREGVSIHFFAFLKHGDLEEAVNRIILLEDIERQEKGSVSWATRYNIAVVKTFVGDFEEYLKIKSELKEKAEKEAEAKKRKKDRKRAGRAEAIRAEQEILLQQAQADLRAREEAKLEAAQKGKQPREASPPEEEAADLALRTREAEARRQEEIERVRRHEEATRRRAQEEAERALEAAPLAEVSLPPAPPAAAPVEALPDIPVRVLYGLTGRPLAVEEEIEGNTWRSTREEIEAYFEALGCTLKAGKGSHGKVELPSMQEIEVKGQLILLVPKSGGALTLPSWEDTVPFYLRKQILKAREILRNLELARKRVVGAQ